MGIFASDTTATVPLPFDAPHTVTLQKLTGGDVERAQAAHLSALVAGRSPRGWDDIVKKALADGIGAADAAQRALIDPLAGYDRQTIVRAGLKAWSYTSADGKPIAVDAAKVNDLTDEALEFIAVEIMRLTKPSLFLTDEERKAAQKNG